MRQVRKAALNAVIFFICDDQNCATNSLLFSIMQHFKSYQYTAGRLQSLRNFYSKEMEVDKLFIQKKIASSIPACIAGFFCVLMSYWYQLTIEQIQHHFVSGKKAGKVWGQKEVKNAHPESTQKCLKRLSTTRLFESEVWKYWQSTLHRKILSCHGNGRIVLELLKLKIVVKLINAFVARFSATF